MRFLTYLLSFALFFVPCRHCFCFCYLAWKTTEWHSFIISVGWFIHFMSPSLQPWLRLIFKFLVQYYCNQFRFSWVWRLNKTPRILNWKVRQRAQVGKNNLLIYSIKRKKELMILNRRHKSKQEKESTICICVSPPRLYAFICEMGREKKNRNEKERKKKKTLHRRPRRRRRSGRYRIRSHKQKYICNASSLFEINVEPYAPHIQSQCVDISFPTASKQASQQQQQQETTPSQILSVNLNGGHVRIIVCGESLKRWCCHMWNLEWI